MNRAVSWYVACLAVASMAGACGPKDNTVVSPEGGGGGGGGDQVVDGAGGGGGGDTTPADKPTAPLLEGMGDYHMAITTSVPKAQRYFDQGMILAWGFNHAESERSFREAARLDPECAMCFWGAALVLGPNINAPMEASVVDQCNSNIDKAVALAPKASAKEQALIAALAKRYAKSPPADRAPLDNAYADAMREVAKTYPDDVDVQALLAESLMDLHPWDYWHKDGTPEPWCPEITDLLEKAMKLAPQHPGANHLYIHAVEASKTPDRALEAASRLAKLVPGAGHLVHMPSHVYIRVGKYHEGSEANERAIKSDNEYSTQCHAQGMYPLLYTPHNWHFLWATASFEGRSKRAIEAAKEVRARAAKESMGDHSMGFLQHFFVTPLYAYARFAKWDEILAEPQPDAALIYPNAVWRYTRGLAYLNKGDMAAAQKELDELHGLAKSPELEKVTVFDINSTKQLINIATEILEGEMAAKKKNYKAAIKSLEHAAKLEYELNYDEPPDWYYPVRHSLGAVYLEAKKPKQAERVYRQDLEAYPENGYALFGLAQALKAEGKKKEAEATEARFKEAWKYSDHPLTSSRF